MVDGNRRDKRQARKGGPWETALASPGMGSDRPRIAILFVNYGPYHLARVRALMNRPQFDPYFIELAEAQKVYPWTADKRDLGERLITLAHQSYESCSSRQIARNVASMLDALQPAAVVIAGYRELPMRAAARWARRNGRGVVVFSESTPWDHPRRWWLEHIKRSWIRRYVDAAVVGGEPHRRYMLELGVDPSRIWDRYNVVDNDFFARRCNALRKANACARIEAALPQNYFLYVGRFAAQKNLRFLLRAYRHYREIHTEAWRLVMVGDGPERPGLFEASRAEGLEDVIWPGFKQSNELPLYYAFAGCFILPSVMEPWGLVVNEAMASGLPILASNRCGCANDLVAPGENGFTFDPASTNELASLMKKIATSSPQQRRRMGDASETIIARWTPESWAEQVVSAAQCAVSVQCGTAELPAALGNPCRGIE
jgi:1,2-diacylglycerol 3-alpha-glucosyltransferase